MTDELHWEIRWMYYNLLLFICIGLENSITDDLFLHYLFLFTELVVWVGMIVAWCGMHISRKLTELDKIDTEAR